MHPLKVTLEDLYKGKTTKLSLQKSVLCADCSGKGSKVPNAVKKCDGCHGMRYKIVTRQIGPGMVQQMQHVCNDCKGEGEVIREKDKCPKCRGAKVAQEKKLLDVYIDKGMKHGQKIVFSGEGDQGPDTDPGDIIVMLQQKEHQLFKRDGRDLYMEQQITLHEALCGYEIFITHLDGRILRLRSSPGQIVNHGDIKSIDGEGMPEYKRPFEKGRLIIKFSVVFPKTLSADAVKLLDKALPKPKPKAAVSEEQVEDVTLSDVSQHDQHQNHSHGGEAYDEDEDDGPRGGSVNCAQQ